jgi:hypothetical protein
MHGYAPRQEWRVSRVAGPAGPPARLGNRPTPPVNGCPQRMAYRARACPSLMSQCCSGAHEPQSVLSSVDPDRGLRALCLVDLFYPQLTGHGVTQYFPEQADRFRTCLALVSPRKGHLNRAPRSAFRNQHEFRRAVILRKPPPRDNHVRYLCTDICDVLRHDCSIGGSSHFTMLARAMLSWCLDHANTAPGPNTSLFALAQGTCYFPGCNEPVIKAVEGFQTTNVQIAHIRGAKPGSARLTRIRHPLGAVRLVDRRTNEPLLYRSTDQRLLGAVEAWHLSSRLFPAGSRMNTA